MERPRTATDRSGRFGQGLLHLPNSHQHDDGPQRQGPMTAKVPLRRKQVPARVAEALAPWLFGILLDAHRLPAEVCKTLEQAKSQASTYA